MALLARRDAIVGGWRVEWEVVAEVEAGPALSELELRAKISRLGYHPSCRSALLRIFDLHVT